MKKNKILFIGSLPTKKVHFNGETNKTGDIYKILKRQSGIKITKINLTHHKLFNTAKMILCSILFKYDTVFVSKCVVGGSYAIHLLLKFANKFNKKKVSFYWIGNGTNGLENKKMYLDDLKHCKNIIFESEQIYDEFKYIGFDSYSIIPCIKPNYSTNYTEKDYAGITTLKCIYFSRICKPKGLMDAIIAIEKANKALNKTAFTLDIAGAPTTADAEAFEKEMIEYINGKPEFTYYGKTFCVTGLETYIRLQQYDLHLFPSQFKQECVPGTVVDMFIAGIPTLSSSFPNVKNLLSDEDSYFFEQGNINDLVEKLIYVYNHKTELNKKRMKSFELRLKYNEDNFLETIKLLGII